MPALPQRIVCLTEEPTELLCALGEEARIVGISGFTVRPAPGARAAGQAARLGLHQCQDRAHPGAAARPGDRLSDMQADIAQALIKACVEVWITNHRSVDGILGYVQRLGGVTASCTRSSRR